MVNKSFVLAILSAIAVYVRAQVPIPVGGYGPHPLPHPPRLMPYDFNYGVIDPYTGNDFGHVENSDGAGVVGSYHVLLPDGRKQIVTYTADGINGFVAKVEYEGVAAAPVPVPAGPLGYAPAPNYLAGK